ncbi:MAG: metallophosphoesterase [Sedimentisphaerales bacterium]|nr:metallophosphoesterase [Sedimentisphaerales bacterium]
MMNNDYPANRSRSASNRIVTRREFLRASIATAGLSQLSCAVRPCPTSGSKGCRFGIVTDCHYADIEAQGTRYYRQSLDKLGECVELMNAESVDFLVELGDIKDENAGRVERETIGYLQNIESVFRRFAGPRYHVLGNHDMDSISKQQLLGSVENTGIEAGRSFYSFDSEGAHFIVLDANYTADGTDYDHGNFDWTDANIPGFELEWLCGDLDRARGPVVAFVHQLLDDSGAHGVRNAVEVRSVLEGSGKVAAVFQGHQHSGCYNIIRGIHYYTLKAVVEGSGEENNSYAIVEFSASGDITVTGYRKAVSKQLAAAAS